MRRNCSNKVKEVLSKACFLCGWKRWFNIRDCRPSVYMYCGFSFDGLRHLGHTNLLVHTYMHTSVPVMHDDILVLLIMT